IGGDGSTAYASPLGITGEYMAGSYILQSRENDGEGGLNNDEDGSGDKDNLREQDIYLPIANVGSIMKNAIPQTGEEVIAEECVNEFISFITSEASEHCHQERKTINGEGILFAMPTLGFHMYVEPQKLHFQKFRGNSSLTYLNPDDFFYVLPEFILNLVCVKH
uniref:Transcription factor CBF/NF-Y/archaeal histone domain-containing protein n=1 Tax=Paramormyrops kingsleyae TaxID=1676925 RepID=A0A3B3R815_9TELE